MVILWRKITRSETRKADFKILDMFFSAFSPQNGIVIFYGNFVKKNNPKWNPQTPIWEMQKSFFSVFSPQNEIAIFTVILWRK